jgi:hypothetical protein
MSDDVDDADLETHISGFLTALGERPEELIQKDLAEIEQPNPKDAEDSGATSMTSKALRARLARHVQADRVARPRHMWVD